MHRAPEKKYGHEVDEVLRDVVVGGEEEHRHVAVGPQAAQRLETVAVEQHDVEHDYVGGELAAMPDGLALSMSRLRGVSAQSTSIEPRAPRAPTTTTPAPRSGVGEAGVAVIRLFGSGAEAASELVSSWGGRRSEGDDHTGRGRRDG